MRSVGPKKDVLKLIIDLVPESTWGENLRTFLGRTKWDKLRKQIILEQGGVCAACGAVEKLECHEIWEFNDETDIQLLHGLKVLCSLCHLATHFGFAQGLAAQGRINLSDLIDHFVKVNGITLKEFKKHKKDAFALWRKRSRNEWTLDFGQWESLLPNE